MPSSLYSGTESLQRQVKEIENKLESETKSLQNDFANMAQKQDVTNNKIENLTSNINATIAAAIANALGDAKNSTKELQDTIKKGKIEASKLEGELKVATEKIDSLKANAENLKNIAEASTDKAAKAYTDAKSQFDHAQAEILKNMTAALKDVATAQESITAASSRIPHSTAPGTITGHSSAYSKYFPDEYTIDDTKYQVRAQKFIDDETPIVCNNSNEMLNTYDLIKEIALNYGILITTRGYLDKWDKSMSNVPPTCPYREKHFKNEHQFEECYSKMKIALTTKLKTKITFGSNYLAADIAITNHSNDGYKMLYELMTNAHPRLKRDSAVQPRKPKFEGDINDYIFAFKNYFTYKEARKRPHIYDDYEKTEMVLANIKDSRYYSQLKEGLDEVDNTLKLWKNAGFDHTEFPPELEIDSIAQSILQIYIERGENPLRSSRGRSRDRDQRELGRGRQFHNNNGDTRNGGVAARAAYYRNNNYSNYGRNRGNRQSSYSRSPARSNSRDSNRSNPRGDTNYSRSNTPNRGRNDGRATRECEYCMGIHLESTVGCPKLIEQYRLQEYLNNTDSREVQRVVEGMERDRNRSRSRSRSSQNDRRGRSNSSGRNSQSSQRR